MNVLKSSFPRLALKLSFEKLFFREPMINYLIFLDVLPGKDDSGKISEAHEAKTNGLQEFDQFPNPCLGLVFNPFLHALKDHFLISDVEEVVSEEVIESSKVQVEILVVLEDFLEVVEQVGSALRAELGAEKGQGEFVDPETGGRFHGGQ